MKKKVTRLRPSPNEEARIIREECDRRRKLRLQQVREQQREFAHHIRQEVEQKRQRELERLEKELRDEWEQQHREKLHHLQQLYQESLQLLGQGHRDAKENEPDMGAIARKEVENYTKAKDRYKDALKELKSQRLKDHERQNRLINARKKALQAEKERSARVASLPLTIQPSQSVETKKQHVVKKIDLNAFATTHYHMSEGTVEREVESNEPTAQEGAELEVRRLEELQEEEKRRRREQLEKARHRGMQAMRREHLTQDHGRLLDELEHMHQADRLRKRQQVSTVPSGIPQPLYMRQEAREDFQREMEFALEDVYTGERGDTLVQLVPKPLPALSPAVQDQDLNVTLDETPSQGEENTHPETQQGHVEQDISGQVKPSKPAHKQALRKLLDRIRSQRNDWTEPSHASAAEPPAVLTDEIPERDTSIDTGSLTSVEKSKLFPSAPELERTKQVSAANSPVPDVPTKRIQEFAEEKEKQAQQEEELERQKQEQVALLRELEEQRVKLEQMLLEAQQEREHLKAAVRAREQQAQRRQPQAPFQGVPAVSPGPVAELPTLQPPPPAGEDEHARQLQEYQQRLLEQNRIHRRTVEVARQRLEEYKRALQLRYTLTARAAPPPPPPLPPPLPRLIPQPPFPPPFLPAAVQLPATPAAPHWVHVRPRSPVGIPTRASDRMASPPRPPGTGASLHASPVLDEELSFSSSTLSQSPDVSSLTDDIMERVTKHLQERVRPSAFTGDSPIPPTPAAAHLPLQSTPGSLLDSGSGGRAPAAAEDEVETQRRDLREAQRRVAEQREAVLLQQREQLEKLQRQEAEMEQMRRQREALQALMQTNVQPPPGATEVSEPIGRTRRKLLATLLRAIEDSSGGSLSHLEEHPGRGGSRSSQENIPDTSLHQTDPVFPSHVPAGPSSLALPLPTVSSPSSPPRAAKPPVTRVRLATAEQMTEQHELSVIQEVETPANVSQAAGPEDSMRVPSYTVDWDLPTVASDRTLQSFGLSNRGQQMTRGSVSAGTSSARSRHLEDRWQTEAEACQHPSETESRKMSSLSSDSGRGADYSGPAFTSCRSPAESAHRTHDSDCVSVYTTLSSGSYVTTDPEQNQSTDKSLRRCVEGQGAALLPVSSPSTPSFLTEEGSATQSPGRAAESLFSDSSIQDIVDRYTRELNLSLGATGRSTGGSRAEDSGSSLSQQSLVSPSEGAGGAEVSGSLSPVSHAAGTQESCLQVSQRRESSGHLEALSGNDASRAEGHGHDSFRPLIGYAADQSSFLPADHRDAAMEQLVGQPSAHSSSIGQLPGLAGPSSGVHSDWDSTLSRMMGQLSQQSAAHWLSGGQNQHHPGHPAQEPRSTWLEEVPEESLMVALVGELDESAGHISGSSGERTRADLGAPSHLSSSLAAPVPGPSPQHRPGATDPLGPTTEASASQSFHQLFAEVTHNQTADPSVTFHPPGQESPVERPADFRSSVSDDSAHSDLSPERFRREEPVGSVAASLDSLSLDSLSQLLSSQQQSQDSVLLPSLTTEKVDAVCPSLTSPAVRGHSLENDSAGQAKCELGSSFRSASPVSEGSMEPAGEKGILEQSQITLVSVTDTTAEDLETTVTEEATWGDKDPDAVEETENQVQMDSVLQDKNLLDGNKDQPVCFLEFDWGPGGDQQRRMELFQRSVQRAEEIKARRAQEKRRQLKVKGRPLVAATCEAKSEPRKQKPDVQSKSGSAERSGSIRQKRVEPSHEAVDVQICTTEQRKLAVSEMHQRTQRLYEQLEEVKQQRTVKVRQEVYAKNRMKAKEFHKKTLQKLRAKPSLQ
ncbi:centrosomal protein 295 isoform X3 [Nelusetta ayraudi]|uniref:centrosomal protein 295 isoform X3 n=1 Tax=Nelusetta ayraudi TaxID=303726 RepID=UPI003F703B48